MRAFVYKTEQIEEIKSLGEMEVIAVDMMDQKVVDEAFIGVNAVYHICSALNPLEVEIGKMMIKAAQAAKVEHFVFHSVLHSVLQDMPHYQKKLMVEAVLVDSGVTYELCGPENLFLSDMVADMEQHFGHEIKVETTEDEVLAAQLKMFKHYNEHGFVGNPNVLTWILGRKPNDFSSFIFRTLKSDK